MLPRMDLRRFGDVVDFLEAAEPFLVAREAEHNLILGVTSNLRAAPEEFTAPPYLATVLAGGAIVAAAMQTPPFHMVLSEIDHPGAIAALADDLVDRDLPEHSVRSSTCERSSTLAGPVAARRPACTSPNGSSA